MRIESLKISRFSYLAEGDLALVRLIIEPKELSRKILGKSGLAAIQLFSRQRRHNYLASLCTESEVGNKVRGHKADVDHSELALALKKLEEVPSVAQVSG